MVSGARLPLLCRTLRRTPGSRTSAPSSRPSARTRTLRPRSRLRLRLRLRLHPRGADGGSHSKSGRLRRRTAAPTLARKGTGRRTRSRAQPRAGVRSRSSLWAGW
ncbi:uncharacterized protein COLE_07204 [Cutaneotrichosporon oleaginosum]|uniref:uncharacterized protein n=1 Tax=Cutaneotrichosporon oleaginosum TaxID=879819 RepID=UPI0013282119|nr:hypothetical protein COLE_07204 [Cutaneotrichosporon oleaginosum]